MKYTKKRHSILDLHEMEEEAIQSKFSVMGKKAAQKKNLHNLSVVCLPGSLPFTSITQIVSEKGIVV